jgi:hypothetical protein
MMAIELKQVSLVTITDPDVQNGYEEALSPYFHDCRICTDFDLIDAIKGMLTEMAEEGHLTERVLKHNTGFILGILSLGK